MFELYVRLIDKGEINFEKSFLHFHVKKKKYAKRYLKRTNVILL